MPGADLYYANFDGANLTSAHMYADMHSESATFVGAVWNNTICRTAPTASTPGTSAPATGCKGQKPIASRSSSTVPRPGWYSALSMSSRLTALGTP